MNTRNKIYSVLAILLCFMAISVIYFSPMFSGKIIQQHDILTYQGSAQEILDYQEKTGELSEWTNSMFGGMPTWLIKGHNYSLLRGLDYLFPYNRECPFMIIFMYFTFAFIAFLLLGMTIPISLFGAIAYGLSTYLFIILEAGHITKALALAYMPIVIACVYAAYTNSNRRLISSAFFALFFAMQLKANHLQIVYYSFMLIGLFVLIHFVNTLIQTKKAKHTTEGKKGYLADFFKTSAFLGVGIVIAVFSNFNNIYYTYEYGLNSTRAKSELTSNADDMTSGLDKSYITASWSYDIDETLDMIVPGSKGGSSFMKLGEDSETYQTFKKLGVPNPKEYTSHLPVYWGTQQFTSGPVYLGIIVFFLFLFGLFAIKGILKWWILAGTILAIFLAWGENFMWFSELFIDYFPGYNKFRTVSMILVIVEFTVPLMAVFALKSFTENLKDESYFKKLKYSFYGLMGLLVLCLIASGSCSYTSENDQQMLAAGWPQPLIDALKADRQDMFVGDLIRAMIFTALAFGLMWFCKIGKLQVNKMILLLAALTLIDLYSVNKRFLNEDDFVYAKTNTQNFVPTAADKEILQDKDLDYRVMNLSVSTFNDASTSYFHKSIGGYHGAKMRRYQEIIDRYLVKMNMNVLNMLNTKYFIVNNQGMPEARSNTQAYGNAWFVDNIKMVENADAEIAMLDSVELNHTAIVDKRFSDFTPKADFEVNGSSIKLTSYKPNHLTYEANCNGEQFAVFSEIYYPKYWTVTIDGNEVEHCRANYILRAMSIPSGKHTIEFHFGSKLYFYGNVISTFASSLIFGVLIYLAVKNYRKRKELATE